MDRLCELKGILAQFRDERDWGQFETLKDLCAALSVESAELLELTLWRDTAELKNLIQDKEFSEQVKGECADILNYLILISDLLNFDLIEAANHKVKLNENRYPVEKTKGSPPK